jgi:hypothetical protein
VSLLDKIRNVRHGNPLEVSAALGTHLDGNQTGAPWLDAGGNKIGEFMRRRVLELQNKVLRHLAVPGLILLIGVGSAFAQSGGDTKAQDKPAANGTQPADAAKDNQRKTDEFAEAAQAINGPAGNPECVWFGRRVVRLMFLDDIDTALRHLDLYDRFGCPGGHVQATFRCLTRFGAQIDPKVASTLDSRVHACWINPAAQPQAAAAATPAPSASTTAGSAAPAPAPSPAPPAAAAPPPPAPAK